MKVSQRQWYIAVAPQWSSRGNPDREAKSDRLSMSSSVVKRLLVIALSLVHAHLAHAHDVWVNGMPVPSWIKAACCGPADAHHLTPDQVHRSDDYYQVDGYHVPIPAKFALPSQDGDYWIFYRQGNDGFQSGVYCFFVPMEF